MSILYINKAHGLPDLDLELTISGTSVTAKLYSANNAGGYFTYEAGIEYAIYAGGTGFTINTGAFSYTTSGELIKEQSGTIGTGNLTVTCTCNGGGSACFGSSDTSQPTYNSDKSSGIIISKLIVNQVSASYMSALMSDTLLLTYSMSESPSDLDFTGTYLERSMSASFTAGSGTFQSFTVKPKATSTGSVIATYSKDYTGWTFSDTELLAIYAGAQSAEVSFPNANIYLELTVTTADGFVTGTFPIEVGGTGWVNDAGTWKRTVPYQPSTQEPCIMYMKINDTWKRGNP
jgi:hypothetical protein